MPRKDRTFTGDDLVRFIVNNLDDKEIADVIACVTVGIAINTARKSPFRLFLSLVGLIARFVPGIFGTVLRLLLRLFKIDSIAVEIDKLLTRTAGVNSRTGLTVGDFAGIVRRADNVIFSPRGPR